MAVAEADEEYPIGFRFKPKDEELVECYLLPMLQHGRPAVRNRFVVEANVYAVHPDTLTNEYRQTEDQQEWFFLSPRARMYPNGTRPARGTVDKCGRWKASTAAKEVPEEVVHNGIRFTRGVLNYFVGPNNNGRRTKWIMLELTIPDFEIKLDEPGAKHLLDRYVAYKLYVSPQGEKKADGGDEEGTSSSSSACEENEDAPHSPGTPGSKSKPSSEKKQAGKRPMVQPQLSGAARPAQKLARRGSPSIARAPTQASSSSAPTTTSNANASRSVVPEQPPTQAAVRTPCYQGSPYPPPQHAGPGRVVFRPQVSLRCHYDHNYRPVQPPAASTPSTRLQLHQPAPPTCAREPQYLHLRPARQPPAASTSNPRAGTAVVPRGTPHNSSHAYGGGSLMTAPPAAGVGIGAPRFNVNAEQFFVELARLDPFLPGAPTGLMAPAPGAPRVETGTGQASGSSKQDAHAA
ncbi:hypothetical protein BS78_02G203100 [Paspalum vaginatum]|nr:hypothetical protein BS78_02G203100 [Paspalum vaginatum]